MFNRDFFTANSLFLLENQLCGRRERWMLFGDDSYNFIAISGGLCSKRSSTQVTWDSWGTELNGWWTTQISNSLVRYECPYSLGVTWKWDSYCWMFLSILSVFVGNSEPAVVSWNKHVLLSLSFFGMDQLRLTSLPLYAGIDYLSVAAFDDLLPSHHVFLASRVRALIDCGFFRIKLSTEVFCWLWLLQIMKVWLLDYTRLWPNNQLSPIMIICDALVLIDWLSPIMII